MARAENRNYSGECGEEGPQWRAQIPRDDGLKTAIPSTRPETARGHLPRNSATERPSQPSLGPLQSEGYSRESPGGGGGGPGRSCSAGRKILSRMVSHSELRKLFCSADAVCFDVDSTVIREEGIDELAKFCGVEDAVSEMTRRAMGGAVPFKAALTERLALIQPSREQVQRLIAEHPPHLTPGISLGKRIQEKRELVSRLQERNVQVFLISGGFRSIVEHVAAKLNIPSTNVFANRLKFYFNERKTFTIWCGFTFVSSGFGFKRTSVLSSAGWTCSSGAQTHSFTGQEEDVFIGFGGNVIRQQVKDNAEWYITDFVELLGELEE
ncbi:phosphoserine phosphatase-like protein [Camelus ferus]|nr:phosphoserine phosphatase-like protein [Camelus ferus]